MNKSNKKGIIFCSIFTAMITIILTLGFFSIEKYETASSIYQVYLDGEKIGMINSKDNLYKLINKEQIEIKEEYSVNQVYPPKGFKIIKRNTYEDSITTVEKVYNEIKDQKEFTVKGYTITLKSDEQGKEPIYIYVLDKNIFEEALENVIETFIGEERYQQYKENTQPEIVDTGYTIENMYFKENITIKESYVSVDETIYTDVTSLTKYLLFGTNTNYKEYQVVQGDTLETIANANMINTKALIMVNDNINGEDTILAIGQKINVAAINPVLSLVYEQLLVEDVEAMYDSVTEEDPTMYVGNTKVKTKGEKGIDRVTTRVQLVNGQRSEQAARLNVQVIKSPQNEVILKGTKKYSQNIGTQIPVVISGSWGWPTNSGYTITSPYGYRLLNGSWEFHDGIDISGTGKNSPIYAVQGGTVYSAGYGGTVGSSGGYNVVIDHGNGYYTVYAHLTKGSIRVQKGQTVSRGDVIGGMGATGRAYGVHLHFGVFYGAPPYQSGSKHINPMNLYK